MTDIRKSYRFNYYINLIEKAETYDVSDIELGKCADYLTWLYKFKKLPIEEIHGYMDRLTAVFDMQTELERTR